MCCARLRHGGEYAEKSESVRSAGRDVHQACGQPRRFNSPSERANRDGKKTSYSMQGQRNCSNCHCPKRCGTALNDKYACGSVYHKPVRRGGQGTYFICCTVKIVQTEDTK